MAGGGDSPRRNHDSGSDVDSAAGLAKDSLSSGHPSRVPVHDAVEAPLLEQVG